VPNLKDIKRRIGSVRKTQQITRAMRMVSAAKLRRADLAIRAARPYAERMRETLAEVARASADVEHPLLKVREEVRSLEVVVITSDRGLAGAFNANVQKQAQAELVDREQGLDRVSLTLVGNKARDFFRRRRPSQVRHAEPIGSRVVYAQAAALARELSRRYAEGEVDQVLLVFNEFVSTMTQRPRVTTLLPFTPPEREGEEEQARSGSGEATEEEDVLPYEFEPDAATLLGTLVPKAVEVDLFRALLESQAGEHAARMTAMENATRNSEELIEKLTLEYNRARQAAITKELMEIVSGAEAL